MASSNTLSLKDKVQKAPVAATIKAQDILTKSVLQKKSTKEELVALQEHITKLIALV
jgi:hypothetical protein